MAYSAQDIQSYVNSIYAGGGTDADVARAMDQFQVSPQEVASAFNVPVSQVQGAYDAATPRGGYSTSSNAARPSGISTLPVSVPTQPGNPGFPAPLTPQTFTPIKSIVSQPGTPVTSIPFLPVNSVNQAAGPISSSLPTAGQGFTNQNVSDYIQNEIVGRMGLQPGTDAYFQAVGKAAQDFQVPVSQLSTVLGLPAQQISQYAVDQGYNIPGIVEGTKKTPTLPPINLAPPVTGEGISTQFIREAPEIEAYKLGLLQEAKRLYEEPIDYTKLQYQVAAPSSATLQSYDVAQQGIGAYQPFVQQGAETLAQGQGLAQQAATMGQLGLGAYLSATGQYRPGQAAEFMNPYQQLVTDQALREIRRQADIAGQTQAAQAVRTGAFGGTREGVQRAEMERNVQDIMSQRIAQDLAQNYAQAQQAAQTAYEAQQQRAIAAGQGIGGLTSTYGSLGGQLGQLGVQQAALGQAAQQGVTTDVNLLNTLGQQQQAQQQAVLEAQRMSNYQEAFDPYTRLGFVSDIYKGAPSTQSAVTATTAAQPSMFQQVLGGVTSGIATAAGAQKLGLF